MTLALLASAPNPTHGTLIGVGDWRIAVEFAFPEPGAALWGVAKWGEAVWSTTVWTDVTEWTLGAEWTRGADRPGARPGIGSGITTLDNNGNDWSPWLSEYYGPGTLVRIVAFSPSLGWWVPQITGVVERWVARGVGTRPGGFAHQWVDVHFAETTSLLAGVNDNALPAVVGSGDTSGQRCVRLLDAANWPFGFFDEAAAPFTLVSTDMARNRLTELYATADSADTNFRAHRSGIAMLEQVDPNLHPDYSPPNAARWGAAVWGTSLWSSPSIDWSTARAASVFYRRFELRPDKAGEVLPDVNGRVMAQIMYDPETLAAQRSVDIIINDARLATAGGTQQVAQDSVSQGRHKTKRTLSRTDLFTNVAGDLLTIAQRIVTRRANRSMQFSAVNLDSTEPGNLPAMFVIDIGDPGTIVLPDYQAVNGHVTGLTCRLAPMTEKRVNLRTSVQLETVEGFVPPALVGSGGGN